MAQDARIGGVRVTGMFHWTVVDGEAMTNKLAALIQSWLDAHPGETLADVARRADISKSTVYARVGKGAVLREMPEEATLVGLARGTGLDLAMLRSAALESIGGESLSTDRPEIPELDVIRAMMADMDEWDRQELVEDAARIRERRRRERERRDANHSPQGNGSPE